MNKKGFAISGIIYSILVLFFILLFCILSLLGTRKLTLDKIKNTVIGKLESTQLEEKEYRDTSGANKPYLMDNMIPIRYNGTNWVYADIYKEWYDYTDGEWANAVFLNDGVTKSVGDKILEDEIALWYVWLPRYKYTIFNGNNGTVQEQTINITFEKGTASTGTVTCTDALNQTDANGNKISEVCTDSVNGNIIDGSSTYTHPAFTYGDTELTGLWIGKFEVSTSDTDCITNRNSASCNKILPVTIKPNVVSWTNSNISNFFYSIENISKTYKTNGASHALKNMEWGAIAYLKQSNYGLGLTDIGINNYFEKDTTNDVHKYITGCGAASGSLRTTTCNAYNTTDGMLASTTGNIYGIYDLSGGAWEYTMGNMVDLNSNFTPGGSGFGNIINKKYYDAYTYDTVTDTYTRGKLGDATKETLVTVDGNIQGWSNDTSKMMDGIAWPWSRRGGYSGYGDSAGVFHFWSYEGSASDYYGIRAVLIPSEEEYKDTSGANRPELLDNMIPVKYDGTNWVYADIYEEWYDYTDGEWANAVFLNDGITKSVGDAILENEVSLWYVWLPRYKYTIFNGNNGTVQEQVIDIVFEKGTVSTGTVTCTDALNQTDANGNKISEVCTDSVNGNIIDGISTYTHPAFTYGDTELTGLWIGKFEVSTSDTNCIANRNSASCNKILPVTIKPNVVSWTNSNISNFFYSIENISKEHDINGASHAIKNMEWGAIAYLKQSNYGLGLTDIGINNYFEEDTTNDIHKYITGCGAASGSLRTTNCNAYNTTNGMLASTTGNIYGIYDLSGGAWEYTMGNMVNLNGNFTPGNSGFGSIINKKYYDAYTYDTETDSYTRGKLGDATKETLATVNGNIQGWSNDTSKMMDVLSWPWSRRGGYSGYEEEAGIFHFWSYDGSTGNYYGTRAVMLPYE